jgi:uncharacterized protein YecE (DUF72 family)
VTVDERGRVIRPPRQPRSRVFRRFLDALAPLRDAGKLGGLLFQLPPYIVWKPSALDYLDWANNELSEDTMLVEFRHRSWFAEDVLPEVLRWLDERGIAYVTVDAPKTDAKNVPLTVVAVTAGLAYVRFHGRNAETWNVRGRSAAERFDYLYAEDELRDGWSRCASSPHGPSRSTRCSTTTTRRTVSLRPRRARSCSADCSSRATCRPVGGARPMGVGVALGLDVVP